MRLQTYNYSKTVDIFDWWRFNYKYIPKTCFQKYSVYNLVVKHVSKNLFI